MLAQSGDNSSILVFTLNERRDGNRNEILIFSSFENWAQTLRRLAFKSYTDICTLHIALTIYHYHLQEPTSSVFSHSIHDQWLEYHIFVIVHVHRRQNILVWLMSSLKIAKWAIAAQNDCKRKRDREHFISFNLLYYLEYDESLLITCIAFSYITRCSGNRRKRRRRPPNKIMTRWNQLNILSFSFMNAVRVCIIEIHWIL